VTLSKGLVSTGDLALTAGVSLARFDAALFDGSSSLAHAAARTTIQMQTNSRVDFSKGNLSVATMVGPDTRQAAIIDSCIQGT